MLDPVGVAQTDTLGTTAGTVPGTVPGLVRKVNSTASQGASSTVIRRLFWGPIRVAMGESISAVNLRPTRRATGGSNSGVSRLVTTAAVRSAVCDVVPAFKREVQQTLRLPLTEFCSRDTSSGGC